MGTGYVGMDQNSWDLWMFIPLKKVSIAIDPYPNAKKNHLRLRLRGVSAANGGLGVSTSGVGIGAGSWEKVWISMGQPDLKTCTSHHKYGIFHGLFEKNLNMS
jgi:hypothetical protein